MSKVEEAEMPRAAGGLDEDSPIPRRNRCSRHSE